MCIVDAEIHLEIIFGVGAVSNVGEEILLPLGADVNEEKYTQIREVSRFTTTETESIFL